MQHMVLTENLNDGVELRDFLRAASNELRNIENFSVNELPDNQNKFLEIRFIFSTWYMPILTPAQIKRNFPSLKYIFYAAGVTEYFEKPFKECGVQVFSATKENSTPVAEFVLAQVILANKGYFQSQRRYKRPFWHLSFKIARKHVTAHHGNFRSKVGLIGCGEVGRQVLEKLMTFDFEIFICDPNVTEADAKKYGVSKCQLEEIFSKCDVISNHLPDISSTRGLLDYSLFSKMKRTATFINTGRGAQVVENDLAKAMRKRPYGCALLDVSQREPMWPWSSLLWTSNIFVTPHIAGSQSAEFIRLATAMFEKYESISIITER